MDTTEVRTWLAEYSSGSRACTLLEQALDEIDANRAELARLRPAWDVADAGEQVAIAQQHVNNRAETGTEHTLNRQMLAEAMQQLDHEVTKWQGVRDR